MRTNEPKNRLSLPTPLATELANAARLAPFACAAYNRPDLAANVDLIERALDVAGGHWYRFRQRHVHGLIAETEDTAIVAIAGTDDRDDWRSNLDYGQRRLKYFAKDQRVRIAAANERVAVHSGFVHVAFHVFDMIRDSWAGILEKPNIWLTGHSLGGAAASLLPVMWPGVRPHVVTFGAPRVVHRDSIDCLSIETYGSHHRWVTIDDLVPQCPPVCYRHPRVAELHYLRGDSDHRHQLPWRDLVWRTVRHVWNYATRGVANSITAGHACQRYADWLEVLR